MDDHEAPRMRAFRVAYDGLPYHGFQRQPDVPTVEGTIFAALADLGVTDDPLAPLPEYAAAGRTDAGTSAIAQTLGFVAPPWLTPVVFSNALPDSIGVWADARAPTGFHATHDAVERRYTYHLHYDPDILDIDLIAAALDRFAGTHDFTNLTPDSTGTERTLTTSLRVEPPFVVITVAASGFPRQLVRRLITVVVEVASDTAGIDRIDRLLDGPPVSGPAGVAPASAVPLVLSAVDYPNLTFRPDPPAIETVVSSFSQRRDELSTRSAVMDAVARSVELRSSPSDEKTT